MGKIIIDTSVWVNFLNKPASKEKMITDLLLDADRVVLCGVELCELLQGTRNDKDANTLLTDLSVLPFLEIKFDIWKQAGLLSSFLRRKGIAIPLSDMLIAAMAIRNHCQIYTIDPHFECIPHVKLFNFSTQ